MYSSTTSTIWPLWGAWQRTSGWSIKDYGMYIVGGAVKAVNVSDHEGDPAGGDYPKGYPTTGNYQDHPGIFGEIHYQDCV